MANVERGQAPPPSRTVLRRRVVGGGGPPGGLGVRGYEIPPKETGGFGVTFSSTRFSVKNRYKLLPFSNVKLA